MRLGLPYGVSPYAGRPDLALAGKAPRPILEMARRLTPRQDQGTPDTAMTGALLALAYPERIACDRVLVP